MNPLISYALWRIDSDLRFTLVFLIALAFSAVFGWKVWLPVLRQVPPTFGDGEFQISDVFYLVKFSVATFIVLMPWLLPFREF